MRVGGRRAGSTIAQISETLLLLVKGSESGQGAEMDIERYLIPRTRVKSSSVERVFETQ